MGQKYKICGGFEQENIIATFGQNKTTCHDSIQNSSSPAVSTQQGELQ